MKGDVANMAKEGRSGGRKINADVEYADKLQVISEAIIGSEILTFKKIYTYFI